MAETYRESAGRSGSVVLDANGRATIPGNLNRFAIIVGAPAARSVFVQMAADTSSVGGPIVNSNLGYLDFHQDHYGTGIRDPITVLDTAGAAGVGSVVGFLEFLVPP